MSAHQEHVEQAISDPTRAYATPMDVVRDDDLSVAEKRKILESWKHDARLLSTAQDENMAGGERPQLQDVSVALTELERLSDSG
ncbi:MAG: hypothetical protein ACREUC_22075 [Steroidobacteraceae bacterium]